MWVQRPEYELVNTPRFTVPDWAHVAADRLRLIAGDGQLAGGARIVATPGHTPGHQSVVVSDEEHVTVLAGQCCSTCAEYIDHEPTAADVHDDSWLAAARRSIERLHRFDPDVVHLAHDRSVWRRAP